MLHKGESHPGIRRSRGRLPSSPRSSRRRSTVRIWRQSSRKNIVPLIYPCRTRSTGSPPCVCTWSRTPAPCWPCRGPHGPHCTPCPPGRACNLHPRLRTHRNGTEREIAIEKWKTTEYLISCIMDATFTSHHATACAGCCCTIGGHRRVGGYANLECGWGWQVQHFARPKTGCRR